MVQNISIDNLVQNVGRTQTYSFGDDMLHHYALAQGVTYTENPAQEMSREEYESLLEGDRTLYVPHPVQHILATPRSRCTRVVYSLGNNIRIEYEKPRSKSAPKAISSLEAFGVFSLQCGERTIIPPGVKVTIHAQPGARYLDIPLSKNTLSTGLHMDDRYILSPVAMNNLTAPSMINIDLRRAIVDVTERVKVFKVADASGLRLGNHYHNKMREWYFLVSGSQQWEVDFRGDRRNYTLKPKEMITIPRQVAHVVMPAPQTEFIGIIDRNFDPTDLPKFNF